MSSQFEGFYASLFLGIGLFLLLRTLPNQRNTIRLLFAGFAIFFNLRYFYWRITATLAPFLSSWETLWQWAFFGAELVAISSLCWHLLVLGWRPRKPEIPTTPDPAHSKQPPLVDVLIATYNEAASLLRPTIEGATKLNYPNFRVHVLDDGDRDWLKDFCQEAGVHYIRRKERTGFKAGNLNHALKIIEGEFIICLDADFVIYPEFINRTLPYFVEPHIGIVQTPQHFRNLDAIQRNLGGEDAWPEDQRVFTDIMQPCRDNWDNAFCYGTNFMVRRVCIDRIGGFPSESICEDFLLTYRLKQHGWITRYHNEELAIGEAADTLNAFITQRVRWCTGTLQCLFLKDGAIRSTKLGTVDRLFYFDSMAYYLSAIWFFFILIAPAVFWWTGYAPFSSDSGHLLMMLAPRVIASTIVLYWLTDRKVIPIVSEIGRYVGIFFLIRAILSTLISPGSRVFKVTDKGLRRDKATFNTVVATPHIILFLVTIAGIAKVLFFGSSEQAAMSENLGLILALSVYAFAVSFISLLACIEPPLSSESSAEVKPTNRGSIRHSAFAILRKAIQ